VSYPPSRLSVRHFSARSGSVPGYDGEGLNLELPLAQSAFSPILSAACLKIAVSIAPAAAMRSYADTVGITLQGQLNITVKFEAGLDEVKNSVVINHALRNLRLVESSCGT
jgi:hypothetical protein